MSTPKRKLLGAIDQGTTSTRFFLFDEFGQLVPGTSGQKQEFKQITPESGFDRLLGSPFFPDSVVL
jgi:glycerol kinase